MSSELRIDITQGNTDPIPIALLKFNSKDNEEKKISSNIKKVISNNLQRSGLFKILPSKCYRPPKYSPLGKNWVIFINILYSISYCIK